ncbi:MAG: type 4a pilus biogenesis protein PilO [Proteobacteria bacterium]|nr:type 4a pilus biogenesis protein PilO [Pseudomonadota bacterium]
MNLEELQGHLEPDNIGSAPLSVRMSVISILFVAIIYAGFHFLTIDQLTQLDRHEKKEIEIKSEFKVKAGQAAKLQLYKEQLAEMRASFGALLRQLPEKTDVESLLVDVSQTGLASGLEILKFKPSAEEKKGFYAELPITLEVIGSFHQMASFISGIAALPRIVTISNLKIEPLKISGNKEVEQGRLQMSATAKTYRYLQEDEQ